MHFGHDENCTMSCDARKPVFGVSDQVQHKSACAATECGQKLGISGFKNEEELYYQCSENKGADQLCSYCTADLRLCFRIGKNSVFSAKGFKPKALRAGSEPCFDGKQLEVAYVKENSFLRT